MFVFFCLKQDKKGVVKNLDLIMTRTTVYLASMNDYLFVVTGSFSILALLDGLDFEMESDQGKDETLQILYWACFQIIFKRRVFFSHYKFFIQVKRMAKRT